MIKKHRENEILWNSAIIKADAATTSRGKMIPQIVLQGNWLEQCGFEAGCSVRVECYPNKLVILKE
ncbi:MAG: type I toxin-antitoxin system SymE family toxin [Butyrivibrio sp.]|nr:type I toxin-antitoxin system SymE family toxin [Acetatifactor muris]MCM1559286.1 type I toxin-antitoxin system SymE family toxin [Butyrivibrio sp.]